MLARMLKSISVFSALQEEARRRQVISFGQKKQLISLIRMSRIPDLEVLYFGMLRGPTDRRFRIRRTRATITISSSRS